MIPKVAFLLGAGLGERLRPMTLATPKPLMPIWNTPLLFHTLRQLATWGVKEVYINTHWLPDTMEAAIKSYQGPLTLHCLYEPEILGTGGALRCLKSLLREDEPFWLINGDIVFNVNAQPIIEAFQRSGGFAAAWLEPTLGPRTVEMDYQQRITCWASPTPDIEHTYTFTGVSLLSKKVLNHLPETPKMCSIIKAFEAAMYENCFVRGVVVPGAYWNDAGTPEAYLQVHRDAMKLPHLVDYTQAATVLPAPEVEASLQLLQWPAKETIVIPLGRRGSNRTFWRLVHQKQSVIAIAYESEERAENARYAACARALKKVGVNVPNVLHDSPNLLLLQDLGDKTLDKFLPKDDTHPEPMDKLTATMTQLALFHEADIGALELEPTFDEKLLQWEYDFYQTHVAPLPEEALDELHQLKALLAKEPQVLMHRDFQSSNILWFHQRPYIIDFQGMRKGPALYDLASFLYDPYVNWSDAAISHAVKLYAEVSGRDLQDLCAKLPYAGLQRLLQAIGAYHRLAKVGQKRFLAYLPIATARAINLAHHVGYTHLAQALSKNQS